jgi:predicted dehydrogenase/threonine dehydrogenase-like Zn-dependent dehydrogenase
MKQVLENFRSGECRVDDVPVPAVSVGCVLVRNHYSVISSGTEGGTVKLGKMGLLGKARARPEQAMKVIQVARTQGIMTAYNAAQRSLEMPIVLGYCSAGVVIEVGPDVSDYKVGDRVACAGAGFANHAEVVCIPTNLCVLVADSVDLKFAACTTLGAIAMQSLRVAEVSLGENVVVIGLGLVGLLTTQLLKAAGCRVIGIDIDPGRTQFASEQDYCETCELGQANLEARVLEFTGGIGADAVIITATTDHNGPVKLAGELARRKARVVCVGRTEMTASRDTYLFKELELRTSMAYGPGTGDPSYEVDGIDYPVAYVRWTENRNMIAFNDLIARGRIDLAALITHEFDIDDAQNAFDLITNDNQEQSIAVLLRYPERAQESVSPRVVSLSSKGGLPVASKQGIGVSVIGAGSFATNEFLPLLAKRERIRFRCITSATGVRAKALGDKYQFDMCASDPQKAIEDEQTECVFILTRHDTHASLAVEALRAGKHVFVEKPLALTHEELAEVEEAWKSFPGLLMVGFNRRFAPLAVELKGTLATRVQPLSIIYRANVGYRPPKHWLHHPQQGGGVILGEACHHIDFCNFLVGSAPESVTARYLQGEGKGSFIPEDNAHISLSYGDGSVATIAYLSNGSKAWSTEWVEVFCDGRAASLQDFKKLSLSQGLSVRNKRLWVTSDKGHAGQIDAFLAAIRSGQHDSIPSQSHIESSRIAIDAALQVRGN